MLAPTNNSSRKTAPPQPGIFNSKRPVTSPISIFIFFFHFSFVFFLFSCQRSTEPLAHNNGPDTTSHDFVWRIDTIGIPNSFIKDVSILDKNDIWAVGEIMFEDTYTYDSLGNWINPYNVVHWDGTKWNLIRALPKNYSYNYYQKSAVLAFNTNDIWAGDNIASHWNGNTWLSYSLSEGFPESYYITKIWGLTSQNMYFIGFGGRITVYDSGTWIEKERGTPLDLYDIDGHDETIFITGYNFVGNLSGQSIALQLINGIWQPIFTSSSYSGNTNIGDYGRLESVYVFGDTAYFATGGTGILKYNYKTKETSFISKNNNLFRDISLMKIVGTANNDIMMISAWGNMVHYNGANWKRINDLHDIYGDAKFFPKNADYKNNTITIVGKLSNRAILIIGEHL